MAINSSDKPVIVDLSEGRECVVNGIASAGYWGSHHVICLSSTRAGAGPDGQLRSEIAIVARLRFDNEVAHQLRDALDQQINMLKPPADTTKN